MKVDVKTTADVTFGMIPAGDCFQLVRTKGDIYMKVIVNNETMCINMKTGRGYSAEYDTPVEQLKLKVVNDA